MIKKLLGLSLILCMALYANAQNDRTYSTTGFGAFSVSYPNSWEIVQDNRQVTSQTSVAVQIMEKQKNAYSFRPNVNVIVSNRKRAESASNLADITIAQSKRALSTYRVISRDDYATLSGCNGTRLEYSVAVQGYNLRAIQYIIKKSDNTTFTITATLGAGRYNEQKNAITSILNSLKIN